MKKRFLMVYLDFKYLWHIAFIFYVSNLCMHYLSRSMEKSCMLPFFKKINILPLTLERSFCQRMILWTLITFLFSTGVQPASINLTSSGVIIYPDSTLRCANFLITSSMYNSQEKFFLKHYFLEVLFRAYTTNIFLKAL